MADTTGMADSMGLDRLILNLYRVSSGELSWDAWLHSLCTEFRLNRALLEHQDGDGLLHRVGHWPTTTDHNQGMGVISRSFTSPLANHTYLNLRFDRRGTLNRPVFECLAPHIVRSFLLSIDPVQPARVAHRAPLSALSEAISVGMLIVSTQDLTVVSCNARARGLIAGMRRLQIDKGILKGTDNIASKRLRKTLAEVAALSSTNGLHFYLTEGVRRFSIMAHVPPTRDASKRPSDSDAILLLTENEEPAGLDAVRLTERHGFTPREARAAFGLLQRKSLEEIASEHHVSIHTIRTQIKSAMKKTGVNSQSALVAALSGDPRSLFVEHDNHV